MRVGLTGGERQRAARPGDRRAAGERSSGPSRCRALSLVLGRGALDGWTALLALLALTVGAQATAQSPSRCALDGGVLTKPQVQFVSVPAGCAVTFKVWGGGGGSCSRSGGEHGLGGGGGHATLRRIATVAETYTLVVGGGGQAGACLTPGPGGSSLADFAGGAGGRGPGTSYCSGGGGGGASLVLLGRDAAADPLVVAAGGGGSGAWNADSLGRPGGVGPWVADGGAGGAGCSSTSSFGGGGGGGGHPLGGLGVSIGGCSHGAGGQNYARDGLSLVGSGREPGNAGDPDRPADAGLGGAGSLAGTQGAIVYTIAEAAHSPSALHFPAVSGAPAEALIESEALTVTDFDDPALARVVGAGAPELSVAGRPWAASDSIAPGETLRLRQLSSASPGQTHAAFLVIGELVTEWWVTTAAEPATPPRRLQVGVGCRAAAPGAATALVDVLLVFACLGAALLRARLPRRGVRPPAL